MKIDAKGYCRSGDIYEKCGKLTFTSESEVDAVQLAALLEAWHGSDKIKEIRHDALERYCHKHNVTIEMAKE
jgi:hypothetical protein